MKELYEEVQRGKQDAKINDRLFYAYSAEKKGWQRKKQEALLMGEIVKIDREQVIPADMLLVYSSNPSANVFVDTTDLDGENFLKKKKVNIDIQALGLERIVKIQGQVICSQPNEVFDDFTGSIELVDRDGIEHLTSSNLLLRQS